MRTHRWWTCLFFLMTASSVGCEGSDSQLSPGASGAGATDAASGGSAKDAGAEGGSAGSGDGSTGGQGGTHNGGTGGGDGGGSPLDAGADSQDSSLQNDAGSVVDSADPETSALDGQACSTHTQPAVPYSLGMYVMMDQSGSMSTSLGGSAQTQWQAAVGAFEGFFASANPVGLSMGIQYFPLAITPFQQLIKCPNATECVSGSTCQNTDLGPLCYDECTAAGDCPDSECIGSGYGPSFCRNETCDPAAYAVPEVPIGALPGVDQAIVNSMKAHGPLTMTPTLPALQGSIQYAREWAALHPDQKTIIVLVTDGTPTICPSNVSEAEVMNKIRQAAQEGLNGTPSIKTFVIGVVMQLDWVAVGKLNQIAQAGGTGQALIVQPDADMSQQLAQKMSDIRGAALDCQFHIPEADGGALEYTKVNVIYRDLNGTEWTQKYVPDASKCDATEGGWYYDPPLAEGAPTRIVLCPQSCQAIQTNGGGQLELEIGCATVEAQPQ